MGKFLELSRENSASENRRWFYSPQIDLIVWMDKFNSVVAFEFYYDKSLDEHVLIWQRDSGFTHLAVDDGEQKPRLNYKQSPILIADGNFDLGRIKALFEDVRQDLPSEIVPVIRHALES